MKSTTPIALAAAALLGVYLIGMSAFEQAFFGWHFAREEVPLHDEWHWFRRSVNAVLCLAMVAALWRTGLRPEPVSAGARRVSWAIAALSVAAAGLLLASPVAYARVGAEDSAIEWLSALLLIFASTLMALSLRKELRSTPKSHRLRALGAAALCFLFFVMAGEEVSWLQRQIGFDAPESVAARNWQGEFNLHNFQTDIAELALYAGTGIFLMFIPLLRESALGRWPAFRAIFPLLPTRTVAALSAPMLIFTYSHWTLLPVQAAFWIGLAACFAFAATAASRGEKILWCALTSWVVLAQVLHLVWGDTMVMPYDSTEYRELFIAIGLAGYGWQQWQRGDA
ncbi:hypothetical protein [Alteriqipengyuania sp.]|uniref:hypothetical protein n=1 Tax=Alteriqipengyuania sp. TaxID=2800692 RepID=UPI0035152413